MESLVFVEREALYKYDTASRLEQKFATTVCDDVSLGRQKQHQHVAVPYLHLFWTDSDYTVMMKLFLPQ